MDRIIMSQNKNLLNKIAKDMYSNEEDISNFIDKYHKINFSHFKICSKVDIKNYINRINKLSK